MDFKRVQQLENMQDKTRELADKISQQQGRKPLNSRDIANLQMLISILHLKAFPVDEYPRNEGAPVTRTLSGWPGPWDHAMAFGCPQNITDDCLLGWALLLTNKHPETEEEMTSLKKCCDLFVEAYNNPKDENYRDRHLRFLWHLIAQ